MQDLFAKWSISNVNTLHFILINCSSGTLLTYETICTLDTKSFGMIQNKDFTIVVMSLDTISVSKFTFVYTTIWHTCRH